MDMSNELLPGQRLTQSGLPRLDPRAVAALALPFMANSAVQAVLNATDTWFMGRISPVALAAMGAVYWPVLVFVFLFGGIGLSVQTVVAQAQGSGRLRRASQATWLALWGSLLTAPAFAALAVAGPWLIAPFGIAADTRAMALAYWGPRMLCAPLGVALWSVLGFFNGIGRPGATLRITLLVAVANALLNQWFVVSLHHGIAGSAWATGLAQLVGLLAGLAWFLAPAYRRRYATASTARLRLQALWKLNALGLPMGLLVAADILGFALFQLMQVHLGTADGAATQIVMVLTSFCYMPAFGIAMAGTTLVGQAIGAGQRDWAAKIGNSIIADRRAVHGRDRPAAGPVRTLDHALVRGIGQRRGRDRRGRLRAAVDRGRLSAVRRAQHLQLLVPARRGRRQDTRRARARAVLVPVHTARSQPVVPCRRRLDRGPAAIRPRRRRRLARSGRVHVCTRRTDVRTLALRGLAPDRADRGCWRRGGGARLPGCGACGGRAPRTARRRNRRTAAAAGCGELHRRGCRHGRDHRVSQCRRAAKPAPRR